MNLRCFFGFHNWLTNKHEVNNTVWKVCPRCERWMYLMRCEVTNKWKWAEYISQKQKNDKKTPLCII